MKTSKQKATTFRLNPEVNAALEAISEHIGATKNKIVNEALADYLKQRGEKLQTELDGTLQKLRQYRAEDPRFETGIERFARAEARCSKNDSHQGSVLETSGKRPAKGKRSLNRKIHELIDA
jgi:predicted DNA-binding protein